MRLPSPAVGSDYTDTTSYKKYSKIIRSIFVKYLSCSTVTQVESNVTVRLTYT